MGGSNEAMICIGEITAITARSMNSHTKHMSNRYSTGFSKCNHTDLCKRTTKTQEIHVLIIYDSCLNLISHLN